MQASPGSHAETGYIIGTNATTDLINAWRNAPDTFTLDITKRIALAEPKDQQLQRAGIAAARNGVSGRNIPIAIGMERDRLAYIQSQGVGIQLDLFGNMEMDDTYNNFVTDYALKKLKELESLEKFRTTANRAAKAPNARAALQGTGLLLDAASHKRNTKSLKNKQRSNAELINIWQNPWTNMDTIGEEINTAFAKAHPPKNGSACKPASTRPQKTPPRTSAIPSKVTSPASLNSTSLYSLPQNPQD